MSEIRKQKKIKGRSLPGLLPVQPSQLAGPASSRPSPPPSSVVFVPTEGGECGRRARAPPRHASSLPACLSSPRRSGWTARRHAAAPVFFPSLSLSLLPGSLFPERTRAQPPPSLAVAVATEPPSPS